MDNNLVLKFFFMVTVYLLAVTKVNSISCYQCAGCSNPFVNNTDSSSTCGTGLDTCVKIGINYPGGGFSMKSCITNSSCKANSLMVAGYGYALTCCNTDLCNSAIAGKTSYGLIFLLTSSFIIFY